LQLVSENIGNTGFYLSENFEIVQKKVYLLLTGRYDYVIFKQTEETLPSRSDQRKFNAFTPKLALNYKITPKISIYSSFGLSFDSPANNELDSPDPGYLFNHDLQPQESMNLEMGIKGNLYHSDQEFFRKIFFEGTLFDVIVDNEIIPYEVLGDVFYRNAAKTNRFGIELGGQLEFYRDLNFVVSYTFSDFTYESYTARSLEQDSTGNFIASDKDFSGNIVPSVPKNNLYLSLSYSYQVIRQIGLFAKMSYQSISGLWVDDENTDKTDAYHLLNSVLGVDMKFGNFNLMLSGGVNNILDEIYVGFTNTNSADKRFYEAGAPRDGFISVNLGYLF
jgi:iron complex outermembrane receptor protein